MIHNPYLLARRYVWNCRIKSRLGNFLLDACLATTYDLAQLGIPRGKTERSWWYRAMVNAYRSLTEQNTGKKARR